MISSYALAFVFFIPLNAADLKVPERLVLCTKAYNDQYI